jgi:hypothetical protein
MTALKTAANFIIVQYRYSYFSALCLGKGLGKTLPTTNIRTIERIVKTIFKISI